MLGYRVLMISAGRRGVIQKQIRGLPRTGGEEHIDIRTKSSQESRHLTIFDIFGVNPYRCQIELRLTRQQDIEHISGAAIAACLRSQDKETGIAASDRHDR